MGRQGRNEPESAKVRNLPQHMMFWFYDINSRLSYICISFYGLKPPAIMLFFAATGAKLTHARSAVVVTNPLLTRYLRNERSIK